MRRLFSLIFATLLTTLAAMADDITIAVDAASVVEAGMQYRVRFTVNSQDVANFQAPDFKGFEVIYGPSTSRQSSFQVINGRSTQSSSITFTYILVSSMPGTYTWTPATVQYGGKTVKSRAVSVKVVKEGTGQGTPSNGGRQQQSAPSAPTATSGSGGGISAKDLFITATASRTNVYEQEAILVTYKIYTLVNLIQLDGKLPTLDGFQIQEIPLPQTKEFTTENYNGRTYRSVVWSQYVLFPQKTGKLTIPSITYEGVVAQPNRNLDPIDAFFNGAGGMVELKKKITTPALTINVKPLPEKPADFSGAVGTFSIGSSINADKVLTNDALTLKVTVKGTGNMKLIATPTVQFPADFETYDAKVDDNFSLSRNGLTGSKSFEFLAVPRHAGTYTIPPVRFTYFDTDARAYRTLTTEAYTVEVAKGAGNATNAISDFTKQDVKELNKDIRYIKLGDVPTRTANASSLTTLPYTLAYIVPLLLFIAAIVAGRRWQSSDADAGSVRMRRANKVAHRRLRQAAALLKQKQQNAFYDEVLKALYGYATNKLNIPQEHLNKDNVETEFGSRGVQPDIIAQFIQTLNDCEFARYAPGNPEATMESIYEKAVSVISQIEDTIKKA